MSRGAAASILERPGRMHTAHSGSCARGKPYSHLQHSKHVRFFPRLLRGAVRTTSAGSNNGVKTVEGVDVTKLAQVTYMSGVGPQTKETFFTIFERAYWNLVYCSEVVFFLR